MGVGAALEADLAAPIVVPRNEILNGLVCLLRSSDFRRGQAAAEVGFMM
jgi:hypothetical protein